jgi:hypothetical protein
MTFSAKTRKAGQGFIFRALLLRQHTTAPAFVRRAALGVELGDTLIAAVGQQFAVPVQAQPTALENLEVVLASLAAGDGENPARGFIHRYLAFERVTFLFAAVAATLLFFGRSMGCSLTSTTTTFHCTAAPRVALHPGSAKAPDLMSAFSTRSGGAAHGVFGHLPLHG